jgi:hypothetical protein
VKVCAGANEYRLVLIEFPVPPHVVAPVKFEVNAPVDVQLANVAAAFQFSV